MSGVDWLAVLAQIVPAAPDEPDGDLFAGAASGPAGGVPAWRGAAAPLAPPSRALWHRAPGGPAGIGVRVTAAPADGIAAALRLAAAAAERGLMPVILSAVDDSGFERFGFRVERLYGATEAERAAVEAELVALWDLAIVVDVADILRLG